MGPQSKNTVVASFLSTSVHKYTREYLPSLMSTSPLPVQTLFEHTCYWLICGADNWSTTIHTLQCLWQHLPYIPSLHSSRLTCQDQILESSCKLPQSPHSDIFQTYSPALGDALCLHPTPPSVQPHMSSIATVEFDNMEPFADRVVTPKSNGGYRPCRDYCRLNADMIPDRYPFRTRTRFLSASSRVLSFLKGRPHLKIPPKICSRWRCDHSFRSVRIPTYTRWAKRSSILPSLMDTVCRGFDFVFTFLDDILIASQNAELHKKLLVTFFLIG